MAYTPHTWQTGETVDAAKLNANEQGTQAAAAAADTANAGLSGKVNSSTYTAGLAGKADYPAGGTDGQSLVKSGSTTAWATVSAGGTVSDASTTAKGIVQLAGDLAGTAAAPTVAKINGATPATVATSGAYADLSGKPTIPTVGAAGAGAAVALSSTDASVTNSRTPTAHAASHAAGGSDAIAVTSAQVSDATTVGKALVTATDAPTARTAIGAGTASFPTQTGNSGKILTTDGTNPSWGAAPTSKLNLAASTYNVSPSSLRLARAAAARAATGGSTFHIAVAGDSTTVGTPGPATFGGLWSQVLLADLLAHGAASRGTGMLSPDVATRTGGPATTTGLQSYNAGIVGGGSYLQNGSGSTLTVTATTDQFRVMYQKRATSGGTITATVDGSAVASIDTSSTGGTGVFFATYNVTQGSHTLVLTAPTNGNGFLLGVEARANGANGSSKVSVFARGGKTSTDLADSTGEGNGSSISAITALAADLLIIDIGINDYLNQAALATYKANLQAAITAQRAVKGDILLVGWPPNSNTTNTIPQSGYIQQIYDLCDANDVALIDFQLRWGSFAASNAAPISYYADPTHPNAAGHADMGNAMYAALASIGVGV